MGGRVRTESEAMALGFPAQVVEYNPRLHPGHTASRVDLEHPGHVPRHVHDDRFIASLAGETGAGAARQKCGAGVRCEPGRSLHVGLVDREDHADGDLAVIGRVAGVGRPRRGIEADFASEDIGQRRARGRRAELLLIWPASLPSLVRDEPSLERPHDLGHDLAGLGGV